MSDKLRDDALRARVDMLREKYARRDFNANIVALVRRGDFDKIDPDAFSDAWPRPIVGNKIDEMARDAAAALAKMPTFRCRAASMGASDKAKARADKRTKIVNHYMLNARLGSQMLIGGDHLVSFGMVATQVVPDLGEKMPVPTVRDSRGFYPVWDARGRTVEAAHVFRKRVVDLKAQYPEFAEVFHEYARVDGARYGQQADSVEWEVIHHDDGKWITLMVPTCHNLVIHRMKNPVGRCLFVCTKRPTEDAGDIRGVFDDTAYVQLARNRMQMLMLSAAFQAVNAPIAAPLDVADVPLGADAIVRSSQPNQIGRIPLTLPNEVFASVEHFKDEMEGTSVVPRMNGTASQITGPGMDALMNGYSQHLAVLQDALESHHQQVAELCFMVDEALWANVEKECAGYRDGSEYRVTYTPSKDIDGNHTVDVTYGTSTGLDPNRHLVYLLQGMGSGLLSKDTVLREMQGTVNASDELAKIQVEQGRDALMAAVSGLAGAIPGLVAEGQDPSGAVSQIAQFVNLLEKGKPLEEIAAKVWPVPKEEPQEQMPQEDPMAALMAGGGGAPPGGPGGGGPMGSPEDDMNQFFAGITSSGEPNLGSYVSRRTAA